MTKRLAVIDGKSVFYRGYYAMSNLSLPDGTPTGGVYGFASIAIELIKKIDPDYVAVAWDKRGTNIRKRQAIYPEYKAGRKPAPDDFYEQIPILYELLDAFGWPLYEIDDYEADDIMGAFAKQATDKGIETCLITSDLDALQLIGPLTKVYAIKKGLSNIEEFDIGYFEKKYGIRVEQFLDLKSLKGDSSDNLPGVPGIGEKTATQLLQKYGTLDEVYERLDDINAVTAKKLKDGEKLAYMSRELGRIWTDAPVELDWEKADVNDTDLAKVSDILKRLQFASLVRRLPKYMQMKNDSLTNPELFLGRLEHDEWKILDDIKLAVLQVFGEEVYLSISPKKVLKSAVADISRGDWDKISSATIISYDCKKMYHQLDNLGVDVHFSAVHDINQAAFLIDPLARDRSLDSLVGGKVDGPEATVAAIWQLYRSQSMSFAENIKLGRIAHKFDFPLIYILFKMEKLGAKVDREVLSKMSQALSDDFKKIEQEIYSLVGYEFNVGSPSQLSDVLFIKLQLPTIGIKKGKTGYSTGQKELDKLRGIHPIIELIEKARELSKLKNTYTDALPLLTDENGRIHTTFNQDVVVTGRLSSTNPNLQNIPIKSELGRQIRDAFIPSDGNVFVSADYSQFELRLAAALAGDKETVEIFNNDVDIHAQTASEVYGVPIGEVTKSQRRNAKVINFGVLYGMSPHGLSAATGMTFSEAKRFIEQYFRIRQPIRNYIDSVLDMARKSGFVETYFGRRRPTPDLNSSNFMIRSGAERAAANMPIQGTEADLMKLAMIAVDDKIAGLGEQVLQVHDSILVECPKQNADKTADILRETMEGIAPDIKVKLKVDVKIGDNWGEM